MIILWEHYPSQDVKTYAPIALPILLGGASDVIYCPFSRDLWVQAVIEGLASGEEVTGRVEGSLDGTNFGNIFPVDPTTMERQDVTISADGSHLYYFHGAVPPYIRLSGFTTINPNTEATIMLEAYFGQMV